MEWTIGGMDEGMTICHASAPLGIEFVEVTFTVYDPLVPDCPFRAIVAVSDTCLRQDPLVADFIAHTILDPLIPPGFWKTAAQSAFDLPSVDATNLPDRKAHASTGHKPS